MSETVKYRASGLLNFRVILWTIPALLAVLGGAAYVVLAQSPGARRVQHRAGPAFDLRRAIIPLDEIRAGGLPKDGIPALTDPPTVQPASADYLNPGDRVAGVALGDQARAYPLKILNYHEIVNDKLSDVPLAVTYCPLCDSVAVFDRRVGERTIEFGVSGLLYNSNVLMYDRGGQPESLWSQVGATGVSGPAARQALKTLPVELTTWRDWQARYPKISQDDGALRSNRASAQLPRQPIPKVLCRPQFHVSGTSHERNFSITP